MKRNTNIELLRIIAMFMIVLSHSIVHSGIVLSDLPLSFNRFFMEAFCLGNLGVIIYIMISGYFMVNSSSGFRISKLFKLITEVLFYSIIIYFSSCVIGINNFEAKEMIKSFFPITFKLYWFATVFVIIYALSPFINKFLNSLSRKEYTMFILISVFIFCVLRMVTTQDFYGNELVQLIIFYSIGGFLGKYKDNIFMDKVIRLKILIICSLIMFGSIALFDLLGTQYSIFSTHSTYLLYRTSIFAILISTCILTTFAYKKTNYSRITNIIAGATFGVYLIHENGYIRYYIWQKIVCINNYVNSPMLIVYIILSVIVVYLICTLIELIRKNSIEKIIDKICIKIDKFQKMKLSKLS